MMWTGKPILRRKLTKREAASVTVITVGILAIALSFCRFVQAQLLQKQVKAALPAVFSDIRQQPQTLINAIEAYKAYFGFYPPDHVISQIPLEVDSVTNFLVYELAGVLYDSTNRTFVLGELEAADAKFIREFFKCSGFKNSGEKEKDLKHFIKPPPGPDAPLIQLHDDPDVYILGSSFSQRLTREVAESFNLSSWRFVSSFPTNNPGKFDLWIEVSTKEKTIIIGNWNKAN